MSHVGGLYYDLEEGIENNSVAIEKCQVFGAIMDCCAESNPQFNYWKMMRRETVLEAGFLSIVRPHLDKIGAGAYYLAKLCVETTHADRPIVGP
jgi:hypothetical protein